MAKPQREPYKKEYLDSLNDERDGARIREILVELTKRIRDFKKPDLIFDEKYWVAMYLFLIDLKLSVLNFVDNERIFYHEYLKDFRFHFLYIIYSHRDLPSIKEPHILTQLLTLKESRENKLYIDSAVAEFSEAIKKSNHKDPLLQAICIEARKSIKKVNTNKVGFGFFLRQDEKRRFAIRYKLLFFNGQYVFRYQDEISFESQGYTIVFDFKSFAHLGRHFAAALGYNPDKSHFTDHFNPKDITNQIGSIFSKIGASRELSFLDNGKGLHMFFELDDTCYTVWFDNITGKSNFEMRVSSIYPSTDPREGLKRRSMGRVKIDEKLYVFKETQV